MRVLFFLVTSFFFFFHRFRVTLGRNDKAANCVNIEHFSFSNWTFCVCQNICSIKYTKTYYFVVFFFVVVYLCSVRLFYTIRSNRVRESHYTNRESESHSKNKIKLSPFCIPTHRTPSTLRANRFSDQNYKNTRKRNVSPLTHMICLEPLAWL